MQSGLLPCHAVSMHARTRAGTGAFPVPTAVGWSLEAMALVLSKPSLRGKEVLTKCGQ